MRQFDHVPPREILARVARTFRSIPAGPKIAGISRSQIARSIQVLLTSLADEPAAVWTPFEPAYVADRTGDEAYVNALARQSGMDEEEVRQELRRQQSEYRYFRNNLYQVAARELEPTGPHVPPLTHLSIKRHDQRAIRDWRHFQRIKNEIIGPECEAVELMPAESRLVDSANQYHLWVITDPTFRWPFGFDERYVSHAAASDGTGFVQREVEA